MSDTVNIPVDVANDLTAAMNTALMAMEQNPSTSEAVKPARAVACQIQTQLIKHDTSGRFKPADDGGGGGKPPPAPSAS